MRISICIPAFRSGPLAGAIRSVQAQRFSDWELIVVGQADDHEVRAVTEAARAVDGRLRYLHIDRRGANRARNAGWRAASGDVVAMLDDDCEADPDWLAVLAKHLANEPDVRLVGGAVIAPPPARGRFARCPAFIPAEGLYDPVADGGRPPPGWDWIGCNFAARVRLFELAGGFDEYLGPGTDFPSADDTDLKLRLEAMGVKMRATPRAVVYHTKGWRYGWRALMQNQRNYTRGSGALAAKLTLMGDPRGPAWVEQSRRESLSGWLRHGRPHRLPQDLRRGIHFWMAYRQCLRDYRVDSQGLLVPVRHATGSAVPALPAS